MTFIKIRNLKRKVLAVLLSLTLIINLLSPALLSARAFAQEASVGPEQAEQSTAPSDSAQASSESVAPIAEPAITQDSSSAEITPEISPVPAEESAVPSEEPVLIVEPTVEPELTPTQDPVTDSIINTEPVLDTEVTPVAEPSATPVPTPAPVWQDLGDKAYETSDNLEINKEYVAPQNDKVKITFITLPESSGKLTIKEIKLTAEQIAQMGALSDTAYDITSTMQDGTFEYDLTLPLPENTDSNDVEVKSAENVEELTSASEVSGPKEENSPDTITIKGLNHFTVFVVTIPTPDTIQRVLINEIAPTAGTEWIELFNNGTVAVDLTGWTIDSQTGTPQSLSALGTIAAAGRAVFTPPAGFLSDVAPETVTILNGLGATIDTVTVSLTAPGIAVDHYPTASESVGRKTDGTAEWKVFAIPTQGTVNTTPVPATGLAEVGAVSATTTFPTWYRDTNGLTLDLMEAADANGISDPVNPAIPFSQQVGFNAEGFWWSAEASIPTAAGQALLVQAVEAAFAPAEFALDGNQSAFARIRIRVDVTTAGTYTVTYPYGQKTYPNVDPLEGINDTVDIGCFSKAECSAQVDPFSGALAGDVGPFLTWDTFNESAALSDPLLSVGGRRYVGVIAQEHAIKGSPTGNNFFRVEGPNIGGAGVNTIETTLFAVTGRLADATAPVITLHGASPVNATQNTVYTDAGATALDDQGGNLTGSIQVTGLPVDTSTLGAKTVTYTVTDGAGRTTVATRTVNVVAAGGVDVAAPVITLLGTTPVSVVAGTPYIDAGATALDDFDGDITANIATVSTVNTAVIGAYTVTYNVSDAAVPPNAAIPVVRTVNVVADTVAPIISLTGSNPVFVLRGAAYTDAGATATDNVDGNLTARIVTVNPVNTSVVGAYTITYNVSDAATNPAVQVTRTVNVVNTLPTGLAAVGAVNPATGFPAWYKDGVGMALQLCLGVNADGTGAVDGRCVLPGFPTIPDITVNPAGFPDESFYSFAHADLNINGNVGRFRLLTEAAFASGIPVSGQQIVFNRASLFTSQAGAFPANSTFHVEYPFGSFDFATDINGDFITTPTSGAFGANTKEMRAEDGPGAALNFTAALSGTNTGINAFLRSTTLNIPGYLGDGATATPVTGGTNGNVVTITQTSGVGPFVVTGGTNWVVAGKMADTTAPVITLNGLNPDTIAQNAVYTDPGATALDDFDGNVTANIIITGLPVNTTTIGAKTITYTVTDRSGNTGTATRTVNVTGVDAVAPVITLLGTSPVSVTRGTVYTDAGATALDDVDGNITANIVTVNPVNAAVIGTYTVTYNVLDAAGNAAVQVTRTVNVVADATAPVITVLGANPTTILTGVVYIDAGATALDNVDGDLTLAINTTGLPISTIIPGTFTVTYTVSDVTGNVATATRTVNVTATPDVTAPVITMLGASPVNLTVGGTYTDAGATALDNIDGNITANIVTTNIVNTAVVGIYTVTYNVTDASGNAATAVARTVNVNPVPVLNTITVPTVPAITGTTQTFTAATIDQFGNPIAAPVTFTSSNPAVGTINPTTGVFTAVGSGTAIITATSGAIIGTTIATVQPVVATAAISPANPTVGVGGVTLQFNAPVTDQFGAAVTAPVTFSSSNPLVATIDPATGVLTPVAAGTTTITVASGAVSTTTNVTVSATPVASVLKNINITAPATSTTVGGANIQLAATPVDDNGAVVAGTTTTFVSNNTAVATVDAAGLVTPVNAGKATIRITSTTGTTTVRKDFNITVEVSVESTNLVSLVAGQVFQPAIGATAGNTVSVTVASPVAINVADVGGKNHKVRIPQGTVITRIDGAVINVNSISATVPGTGDISGFVTGATVNGALQWGIPNIGLAFATPVTLDINVGAGFNGQTLNVSRSTSGNAAWTTDGIVNPSCVVANGLCSFQITKASFFATYTLAQESVSSNSSSGSSGSGDGQSDGLGCGSHDCSGNILASAQVGASNPAQVFEQGFIGDVLGVGNADEQQPTSEEAQPVEEGILGVGDDTATTTVKSNNALAISITSILVLILAFAGYKFWRRFS